MTAPSSCHTRDLDASVLIPWYAQSGLPVLPLHAAPGGRCTCGRTSCASPGKHPRTRRGVYDATTDIGDIAEWLAAWPNGNFGVAVPEGVVVIDVDIRNNGDRSMDRLEGQHGQLPRTLTARTGGGGWHLWFAVPGPIRGRLAEGVDAKHLGGFVCVPPSRHASGAHYAWLDIPDEGVAQAPSWLVAALRPPTPLLRVPTRETGGLDGLVRAVAGAQPGNRNSLLFWAARRAIDGGHRDLAALADAAHRSGLELREVESTLRSALRGAGAQKQVPA